MYIVIVLASIYAFICCHVTVQSSQIMAVLKLFNTVLMLALGLKLLYLPSIRVVINLTPTTTEGESEVVILLKIQIQLHYYNSSSLY